MRQLKGILINRLKNKGMEMSIIPGFIKSLTNSFVSYPHLNLLEVNNRLRYMGWDDFELDYFTFQLAIECLEGFGWKRTEYKPVKWFENKFMAY